MEAGKKGKTAKIQKKEERKRNRSLQLFFRSQDLYMQETNKEALSKAEIKPILSLSIDSRSFNGQTDEGTFRIPWDYISNIYLVIEKRNTKVPLLIFKIKDYEKLLELDSSAVDTMKILIDGSIQMKRLSLKSIAETNEAAIDAGFRDIIKKIVSHLTLTLIDEPLQEFIHNESLHFPTFSTQQEIIAYCFGERSRRIRHTKNVLEESLKGVTTLTGPITSRDEWKIGYVIDNRYRIENTLYGGMGTVYVIMDTERDKYYALKTFQEKYLYDPQVSNQFIREAEIWTNLGKHKNIVQAERVMIKDGKPFIFLEYMDGDELEKVLQERKLDYTEVLDYSLQFCEGMNYAYELMGLVHRDIKPANCFITKEKLLKISDFGLGKLSYESSREAGKSIAGDLLASVAMVGTLPYMAPELFTDMKQASTKTDIYAFGIMLYEMLTGKNPFHDEDLTEVIYRHLNLEPPRPSELNPEITPEMDALVLKCLEKDPADRYNTFLEISKELKKIYKQFTGKSFISDDEEKNFTEEDWIKKGLSLASLKKYDEAVEAYDEAIKMNSRSPAIIHKGVALSASGAYDRALETFDDFLQILPDYWKIWFHRGDTLREAGRYEEALENLNKALSMSQNPEIIAKIGRVMEEQGNVTEAIEYYEQALQENQNMPAVWFYMGCLLMRLNKYETAQDAFSEATELNPRFTEAWYYRGHTFLHLGFFKEAINAFNLSLSLEPDYIQSLIGIGNAYFALQDYRQAREYYEKVHEKDDSNMDAAIGILTVLCSTGRLEEAVEYGIRHIKKYPENTQIKPEIANICFLLHYYEESIAYCNESVEENITDDRLPLILNSARKRLNYIKELDREFSTGACLEPLQFLTDLNTLLSVFCSISEAKRILNTLLSRRKDLEVRIYYFLCVIEKINLNEEGALEILAYMKKTFPRAQEVWDLERMFKQSGELRKPSGLFGKKDKKGPEYLLIEGLERFNGGHLQEALEILQDLYMENREMASCLFFCSKILRFMYEYDKADNMLEDFINIFPQSAGYYREKITEISLKGDKSISDSLFLKWIEKSPYDFVPWIQYLKHLTYLGHREKTEIIADLLLNGYMSCFLIDSLSADFQNIYGYLLMILNRPVAAADVFEQAGQYFPDELISKVGLCKAYRITGRKDPEKALLDSLRANESGLPYLRYLAADYYSFYEEYERAMDVLADQETIPVLRLKKAQTLYLHGDLNDAYEISWDMLKKYSDSAPVAVIHQEICEKLEIPSRMPNILSSTFNTDLLKIRGREQLRTKQNDSIAIQIFKKASELNRLDFQAYMLEGTVFYKTGRYRLALNAFNQAKDLRYDYPPLWILMGAASHKLGESQSAETYLRHALEIAPTSPEVLVNLSIYLMEKGSLLDAQQYAEKAIRIAKDYGPAWLIRGKCLMTYGNMEDAEKSADSAIFMMPTEIQPLLLKSCVYIEEQKYNEAFELLRTALDMQQAEDILWYNLGVIAIKQGRTENALSCAEKAVNINPHMFEAIFLAFLCLFKANRHEEAKTLLNKAEELDPKKAAKWLKVQSLTNDITAPLKPLSSTSEPFFVGEFPATEVPEPFYFMETEPII